MFARNVSIHLKSNMLSDYTRTFEKEILPLLRRQKGFKDEITFAGPGGVDVTAISLWENKTDAEAYNTNTYPAGVEDDGKIYRGNAQGSDLGRGQLDLPQNRRSCSSVEARFFRREGG